MTHFRAILIWCMAIFPGLGTMLGPAHAQSRVALVIGNNRYPNLPADRQLTRAVNDARAVAGALEKIGFTVVVGENLDRQGMVDRIFDFTQKIAPGDTAMVFFAGHGVAISGGNFLLPSDVREAGPGEEARVRNMAIGEADYLASRRQPNTDPHRNATSACRNTADSGQGGRWLRSRT